MRKGNPVVLHPALHHMRRRHRVERRARAARVPCLLRLRAHEPEHLDAYAPLAADPPPRSTDRECPHFLTVPCCSGYAPHFWLSPRAERWVVVFCVALVVALCATVSAGASAWAVMEWARIPWVGDPGQWP